jgi:N utilization substance protein A
MTMTDPLPADPADLLGAPTLVRLLTVQIVEVSADSALLRGLTGEEFVLPVTQWYPNRRWEPRQRVVVAELEHLGLRSVSATAPQVVAGLLDGFVPEVRDGVVRVMGVARAPGVRTKVAVASTVTGLDPVTVCVGRGASRVRAVSAVLGHERLDVVAWHPDRAEFLRSALAPAKVGDIRFDGHTATVSTARHRMAQAVGEHGLNAQLAGQLAEVTVSVVAD